MIALPIDASISEIVGAVRERRALVLTAAQGAGKSTRVPPALTLDGRVVLLQPRRIAARAIAERIAAERGWTVGDEVGWHVRFERRASPRTKLLVVTEGVLNRYLQRDPLLEDFRTIVLDEFHERSIHADLAIAFAKQAWLARSDLRLVVMSATMATQDIARFLNDCPVMQIPGQQHPLDIQYEPGRRVSDSVADLLRVTPGSVLCFLPGAREIERASRELEGLVRDVDVLRLHGSLTASEQQASLTPSATRRRIIVATNIAETSLTVPDVTGVVDSGLHKVARYDVQRAIDTLELERVPRDSADQRAGRAGRIGPGDVRRLWDARDRLRPHREPDIERIDLAGPLLDVVAWGAEPDSVEWFEPPTRDAIDAAVRLLRRLGAFEGNALSTVGRQMQRLPLHPRLARILITGAAARPLARACALLSERHFLSRPDVVNTSSDLLVSLDRWDEVAPHVRRVAREIETLAARTLGIRHAADTIGERHFLEAIFTGYPDRVGKRRGPGSMRVKLATGVGALIAAESGVREGEYLVALEARQRSADTRPQRDKNADEAVMVTMASRIEEAWLHPLEHDTLHRLEDGVVRATLVDRYDAITVSEHPARVDAEIAAELLTDAWIAHGPDESDAQLINRARFAGVAVDVRMVVHAAARSANAVADIRLASALAFDVLRVIERLAPERLPLPSGRSTPLEYMPDGTVRASAKLQELFGLADTPMLGPDRKPVILSLLAPNRQPVQVTTDLRSFWNRTYPDVRKELRGRYPKHPWPEDPWTAMPTAKTTPRSNANRR